MSWRLKISKTDQINTYPKTTVKLKQFKIKASIVSTYWKQKLSLTKPFSKTKKTDFKKQIGQALTPNSHKFRKICLMTKKYLN